MLRSFVRLIQVDPGFRPANVVTADALLSEDRYPAKSQMLAFYRSSLASVRSLPGVESAAMITHLPFGGNDWGNGYQVEGQSARDPNAVAQIRPVSPGYFSTLGIPLRSGVDFSERDSETAAGVAIVSELLARRSWPNDNAVGKKIRYGDDWLTVVGVCGDIKHGALDESAVSMIYVPYPQVPAEVAQFVARDLNFVVRSSSPGAAATGVRGAIHALDPAMVVSVSTLEALIHDSTTQPRFRTWLIGIFSILALSLACLGIYGVIAYLVTQRYKEIGIRLALGATRANILSLVLGPNLPTCRRRHRRRFAGGVFPRAFPRHHPLRHHRARSAHLCCGAVGIDRDCASSRLPAGAARHAGRSGPIPPLRVTLSVFSSPSPAVLSYGLRKETNQSTEPERKYYYASKNRNSSLGRHSERGQGNDETRERRL